MKNKLSIRNFIMIFILTLGILSCVSKRGILSNEFSHENGTEKLVLKIISNRNYLIKNKDNLVKITLENIDSNAINIAGKTIRRIASKNIKENEIMLQISPTENDLEDGKLVLFFSYKMENKFKRFKMYIPVKK